MITNSFSFLKDFAAKIIFFIFIANIFYDDPTLYLYKRIVYSLCIYYVTWEILKFYYKEKTLENSFKMPAYYLAYIPLLFAFIIIALFKDFNNPNLKLITLFNNPFALLLVGPIFLFAIGTNSEDLKPLFKVLLISLGAFIIVVALPIFGKLKYYQGYICANAFIPLFFISNTVPELKKYRYLTWPLLIIGVLFSQLSDYRIIALRILLFIGLYIGFSICKKFGILKCLIILMACLGLYLFINNMQDMLYLFSDIIGVRTFDDDDTRGFLYEEVLGDLNGIEYIFGRGFVGSYFSQYFLMLLINYRDSSDHYDRFSVEVGFLELLLKGGYVLYFLYILPLVYASVRGIFWHYKNPIVFYISIFIFTELLLMYIENFPYFGFQFSLLFFLAGYSVRKMTYHENLDHNSLVQPG